MNSRAREDLLQKISADKNALGIPVEELDRIAQNLLDRWGVEFIETPLYLTDYVVNIASSSASASYLKAAAQAVKDVSRGGSEAAVYDCMCDPELLGIVTSSRRAFLIDGIAITAALYKALDLNGPILDVGCHAGIACDLLESMLDCGITVIDPLANAIMAARERASPEIDFYVEGIPWETDRRFDLVLSIDSMPYDIGSRAHFLRGVSHVLNDGGIAVIVSQGWFDGGIQLLRRQLAQSNLGFGFADVVGGYTSMPTSFQAEGCLVLLKGGKTIVPSKLRTAMESDWQSFSVYANLSSTEMSKKTQAFKRALAKESIDAIKP
jgi:hypothetical protein